MLRIFLIVTIVAGIAATVITLTKVQDIIVTTRKDRDEWHQKDTEEIAAHTKTKATLKTTQTALDSTKKELGETKRQLADANSKVDDLSKDKADLTAKLDKSTNERDDALGKLEQWRELGLTIPQIKGIVADLDKTKKAKEALIAENKILNTKLIEWTNRWETIFQNDQPVILPAGLHGKIVAVDPKFNFVVLNIGSEQGVLARGEMDVDHNGKFIGKVRISSVSKTECVANILPTWKRGEVMEGDEVLY